MTYPNDCICTNLDIISPTQILGRFVITPVNASTGISIGNVLRRVLFSEVNGLAIKSIRIQNIKSEFEKMPGVREDVLELIQNLRNIVLKPQQATTNHGELNIGRIRKQGPAVVTAGDLELPLDIKVVDPEQYILTIQDNSIVELEFKVGFTDEYSLANDQSNKSSDFLSVGTPIIPVTGYVFEVQSEMTYRETFDSLETIDSLDNDKHRLILDIWTNGSMTPQEALSEAAYVLKRWFETIESVHQYNYLLKEENKLEEDNIDYIDTKETATKHTPIEEMGLSSRAYKALKRAGIETIGQLVTFSENELLQLRNFGEKSAREVKDVLQEKYGIYLE